MIAAEAELIDEGESPSPAPALESETWEPEAAEAAPAAAPFVTETMAELYAAQGFREQALAVYVQLLAASPEDARLQGLVASLAPSEAVQAAPNVRDFFARMAQAPVRGAATRGAETTLPASAIDDFAPPEHVVAAESPRLKTAP